MRTETVEIGGKEYVIEEKKRKANSKWRLRLQSEFTEVATLIDGVKKTDMTAEALGKLIQDAVAMIGGSVDSMAELVFAYSAALAAERETIEEEAYDSEIMAAFTACLKLAYPFGSLIQTLGGLATLGRPASPTSPNSSSESTA